MDRTTLPPSKLDHALEQASAYFGSPITRQRVRAKSKAPFYCSPRQWVMAYLRWKHAPGLSLPQIAKMVNVSDHTTVLNGDRRARERFPDAVFCGPRPVERNFEPVTPEQLEDLKKVLTLAEALVGRPGDEAVA